MLSRLKTGKKNALDQCDWLLSDKILWCFVWVCLRQDTWPVCYEDLDTISTEHLGLAWEWTSLFSLDGNLSIFDKLHIWCDNGVVVVELFQKFPEYQILQGMWWMFGRIWHYDLPPPDCTWLLPIMYNCQWDKIDILRSSLQQGVF